MYKFLCVALACISLYCFTSCATDAPKKDLLNGSWLFTKGALDGDEAMAEQMFKGFEVEFTPEGLMRSAILEQLGLPKEMPFVLDGQTIRPKDSEIEFEVKELTEKALTLDFSVTRDGRTFNLLMSFSRKPLQ